jgi:NADPH-dependent 2,4-dienoyl-CoA reductase/sulfur reductase-like enzyme
MILKRDPESRVVIFSDEPHGSYFRPLLPNLIAETIERRFLFEEQDRDASRVDRRLEEKVRRIDPEAKRVILESGSEIAFDRLLVATGSSAHRPEMPGERRTRPGAKMKSWPHFLDS